MTPGERVALLAVGLAWASILWLQKRRHAREVDAWHAQFADASREVMDWFEFASWVRSKEMTAKRERDERGSQGFDRGYAHALTDVRVEMIARGLADPVDVSPMNQTRVDFPSLRDPVSFGSNGTRPPETTCGHRGCMAQTRAACSNRHLPERVSDVVPGS